MKSIGIDIGCHSIKVAEVVTSSNGFALTDFVELPLAPEPGVDQRIEIVDYLRRVVAHYGVSIHRVVFAAQQEHVSVRMMTFPFRERHNILKSLPAQLEDDIPLGQDDAIFDAKILRNWGSSAEVLAVACPKERIKQLIQMASEAGIDPDIITVDVPAAANIFEAWSLPPRDVQGPGGPDGNYPAQILIQIGHRRTFLCVFYRGTLLTTRTISRGGHDIVESLRRTYQLPYIEAIKGLQEKGFVLTNASGATKDQIDFSNVILNGLKPIADDVKLTLLELRSTSGLEFDQVYLTGGVSRMMNIAPYFTQELEIPSNVLKLSERIPKSGVPVSPELDSSSLVAVGVALEGLKRPRNPPINLRKHEFGKQSQSLRFFIDRWGTTLRYTAVLLAIFWVYAFVRSEFADSLKTASLTTLSDVAKKEFQKKGTDATEGRLKAFIKEQRNEISAKEQIAELQNLNSALDVVLSITEKAPPKNVAKIDIRRLLVRYENLTIEGEVGQMNQVEMMRNALTDLAVDRKVKEMTPSLKPGQGKLAFAFSIKVDRTR